jgi:hypothetical protein
MRTSTPYQRRLAGRVLTLPRCPPTENSPPCAGAKGAGKRAGDKGKVWTVKRSGGKGFYCALRQKIKQNKEIVIGDDAVIVVCGHCTLVHYSVPGKRQHQHSSCAGPNKHKTSHLRGPGCDCVPDAALPSACTRHCAHR